MTSVLVLFVASWCGTACTVAKANNPTAVVMSLDSAEAAALADSLGVRGVPELHSLKSKAEKVGI
jgi:hypothetical protein